MLGPLQAERQMAAIEAVAVPHMKDGDRSQLIGKYQQLIAGKPTRPRSLREALGGMPLQRVLEPKKRPSAKRKGDA